MQIWTLTVLHLRSHDFVDRSLVKNPLLYSSNPPSPFRSIMSKHSTQLLRACHFLHRQAQGRRKRARGEDDEPIAGVVKTFDQVMDEKFAAAKDSGAVIDLASSGSPAIAQHTLLSVRAVPCSPPSKQPAPSPQVAIRRNYHDNNLAASASSESDSTSTTAQASPGALEYPCTPTSTRRAIRRSLRVARQRGGQATELTEVQRSLQQVKQRRDELALEKHAQAETITGLVMKLSAKEMELSTKEQMVAELKKEKEALMREKRELMKEKRDLMREKRELMTEKRELMRDKRELMRDKYELMAKLGSQRLKKQELLHNLNALKAFVSHNF
jgi:hypothetical protein